MRVTKNLVTALGALGVMVAGAGNTCTWTGLGHDGLWSTKENWKDEVMPVSGNGDTAIIPDDIGDANLYFLNGTNTVNQDIADDFSLGTLYLANSNRVIHITGKSLKFTDAGAIRLALATANSGPTGKGTTYGGTIDNDLAFTKNNSYILGGLVSPVNLTFNGRIDATGWSIELRINSNNDDSHVYFNKPVSATTLLASKSYMQVPVYLHSADNAIGTIKTGYGRSIVFDGFQPFPADRLPILGFDAYYKSQGCCSYSLHGDVTVDSFQTDSAYQATKNGAVTADMMFIRQRVTPAATPTLTLRPAAGRQAVASVAFANPASSYGGQDSTIKANLVLDGASDARQTFWNRRHRMDGTIAVKAGTLELAGTTTFEDVTELSVAAGAELTVANATNDTMFASVTNVTLGGTLTLGEDAVTPFGTRPVAALRLTTGAKVAFTGTAQTLAVDRLFVNGKEQARGTFDSSDFIEGDGAISVLQENAAFPSAAVYTWTGGGADTRISTTGNFKEGDPELTPASSYIPLALVAKIADPEAANRTMTLDGTYPLHGLIFAGAAGAVADGTGSALLRLASSGITVTKDTDGETVRHSIGTPVSPMMDQTWSVPTNATVELAKGVTADPDPYATPITVTKSGKGHVMLNGRGGAKPCDYTVADGYVIATGNEPFGAAAEVTVKTQDSKKGARVVFSNVVTSASFTTDANATYRNAFEVADGTTNVISGRITYTGCMSLTIPEKAHVTFAGGYGDSYSCLNVAGTCVVSNTPMIASTYESAISGLMILACSNNTFGSMHKWKNSEISYSTIDANGKGIGFTAYPYHIRLDEDEAFNHTSDGKILMDGSSWIDLNGHDTHIRSLHSVKGSTIHSYAGPATLYVTQQGSWTSSYTDGGVKKERTVTAGDFPVDHTFKGEVSLVKDGTDTMMLAGCHEATGTVTVAKGVLSFTNRLSDVTASWPNATAVTVKDGATLEAWNAKLFNRDTVLTLGEAAGQTGTLAFGSAAKDVTGIMYVGELRVNGVKMPNGKYGAADNAAVPSDRRLSCITGKGIVRCGPHGTQIFLR